MKSFRIILIFLGVAIAIVILSFQKEGIMEGENILFAAMKKPQKTNLILKKKAFINYVDSTIIVIEQEDLNLLHKNCMDIFP